MVGMLEILTSSQIREVVHYILGLLLRQPAPTVTRPFPWKTAAPVQVLKELCYTLQMPNISTENISPPSSQMSAQPQTMGAACCLSDTRERLKNVGSPGSTREESGELLLVLSLPTQSDLFDPRRAEG
jgi:hypothetical protein